MHLRTLQGLLPLGDAYYLVGESTVLLRYPPHVELVVYLIVVPGVLQLVIPPAVLHPVVPDDLVDAALVLGVVLHPLDGQVRFLAVHK